MLAVARRGVVTDKVDVMLKIGLGAVGRVSFSRNSISYFDHRKMPG
jgi:hypothetical protein